MKVLHITNWYPSKISSLEGVFVKEHIDSLKSVGLDGFVYHIRFSKGPKEKLFEKTDKCFHIVFQTPHLPWSVLEIFSGLVISIVLLVNKRNWDLINFHIAYPNLYYFDCFQRIVKKPFVCIEHWSGYGQNFGLPRNARSEKKLRGVKRIFSKNLLFLFVSNHLKNQVIQFSKAENLNSEILPNVVNNAFKYDPSSEVMRERFFAASVWRKGKRPFELIRGFHLFSLTNPNAELVIAGEGELFPEMRKLVIELDNPKIFLLGYLDKQSIASWLNISAALCHSSDHETFSVICTEALSCGCPVIVNKLPALQEYLNEKNSLQFSEITIDSWRESFTDFYTICNNFDRETIARNANEFFSSKNVGLKYYYLIRLLYEKFR